MEMSGPSIAFQIAVRLPAKSQPFFCGRSQTRDAAACPGGEILISAPFGRLRASDYGMVKSANTDNTKTDKRVADAVAELKGQGIPVAGDPTGRRPDLYIATAPNGEKYEFTAAGLLDLKAKEKLHLEGLQEAHLAKKSTPNL